jgi:hypothetical protein
MTTKADRRALNLGCVLAFVLWTLGGGFLLAVFSGHSPVLMAVGWVLLVVWTPLVLVVWSRLDRKWRTASERAKWAEQEATRARKKAWREGRK